jgi:hypothetical protein
VPNAGLAVTVDVAANRLRPGPRRPGRSLRPRIAFVALITLVTLRALRPGLAPRDRRLARVTAVGRRIDEPQLAVLCLVTAADYSAAADLGNGIRDASPDRHHDNRSYCESNATETPARGSPSCSFHGPRRRRIRGPIEIG